MIDKFRNTAALRYVSVQVTGLERLGYPVSRACEILDVPQATLTTSSGRIDLAPISALYDDAAIYLDDPHIALRVGCTFRSPNYGKTGSVYGFCNTLADVLVLNARYQKLAIDAGVIRHDQEPGTNQMRHFMTLEPYDEIRDMPNIMMLLAGAYSEAFSWLTWGSGKDLKAITLPIAPPEDPEPITALLSCRVNFETPSLRVEFHDDTMFAPMATHNPEQLAQRVSVLDAMLGDGDAGSAFLDSVRQSIRGALGQNRVSQAVVAERLGLTERQLRVRLSGLDTSFRTMLDAERQSLFHDHHNSGETFAAIAQYLGYNDQAAFSRAFKRWYGVAPGKYMPDS